jgi:ABC-2 family transporter protein
MSGLGAGPVFVWEWRRMSRQWWFYAMRSVLVGGLLAGLGAVWWALAASPESSAPRLMVQVGQAFFGVIGLGQIAMVLLAAPASTAGTFCMENARGQVRLMLVTEVTPLDIVLGVLAARLLPVLAGILSVVPVLALTSHLGGIPTWAMIDLVAVTAGGAAVGCALALLLSIGARKFHEALVATYVMLAGWALGYPILQIIRTTSVGGLIPGEPLRWLRDINPFWLAMTPVLRPGLSRSVEVSAFLAATLTVSASLIGLAAARLRAAVMNDQGSGRRPSWSRILIVQRLGSMLDRNPVFWRECRLQRSASWIGLLCGLYIAGAMFFSTLAVVECSGRGARATTLWAGPFNGFQAAVGLLLLSLVTPASLAEDRARGTLELLLSTPLSSPTIVLGKWLAHYRLVPWLTLLPAMVAVAHAVPSGRWLGVPLVVATILAQGAAVTSLGIALAIWVPRLDRALTFSAAAAVFFTVVWIPLVLVLCRDDKALGMGLASASPLFGIGMGTSAMVNASPSEWARQVGWAMFWILACSVVASALIGAALASFEGCLGRMRPLPSRRLGRYRGRSVRKTYGVSLYRH